MNLMTLEGRLVLRLSPGTETQPFKVCQVYPLVPKRQESVNILACLLILLDKGSPFHWIFKCYIGQNWRQDRQENCGGIAALSLLAVKPPRHWLTPQTHAALHYCATEHLVAKHKKRFASAVLLLIHQLNVVHLAWCALKLFAVMWNTTKAS